MKHGPTILAERLSLAMLDKDKAKAMNAGQVDRVLSLMDRFGHSFPRA